MLRILQRLGPAYALALATCVVAFVFLGVHDVRTLATWIDSANWTPTAATVVQVTYSGRNHTWTAYYRYEVGGLPHTGSYWRRNVGPKVGDAVTVIFDPGSPDRSARSREDLFGRPEVGQWFLLLLLAAITWMLSTTVVRRQPVRPVPWKTDRRS